MKRFMLPLLAAAAMLVGVDAAQAQVPYVTYYSPSTVYYSTPVTSSYVAPTVTYSAPTRYYSYYPSTYYYSAYPSYSYYSRPVVTRYRPLLGGTVSRYVTTYAPAYYSY
jgi:hypothetical protein